ncbi:hypothetical protein vecB_055 [Escherichia phage VEcB]|uniref:PhoH-like protein domain-containing protein n=1 Tax=Escherichia phage VEcB TaxID=2776821 RepID=A0A7L8ZHF3_9CAUD|nr:peptidase HslV family [Escherichia phage VEcB]QOI67993.1 hypothetical protein vecB_055 [Escherichia phage VEcB]
MGNKTAKARRQSAANDDKRASRYAAKAVGNDDYRLDEFTPVGNQEAIVRSMVWNDLTIVNAPAGTGKTTTALWKALQMLKAGDFRKLIFLKNPTEVGDDQIGFLSGDKTDKLAAQETIPGLVIQSDPDKEDEEFVALVVHPDGKIYMHEGNNPTRAYPLTEDYYAVGSGADFALAALDAGATPEEAMEVAKLRDAFSGGETFIEEIEEQLELTAEDILNFSKEQLISMLLTGDPDSDEAESILAEMKESQEKVLTVSEKLDKVSSDN